MLSALFVRAMASQRFRRIAGYIGLTIAAIALLWLGKALYDRSVVNDYKAERNAEVQQADAVADDLAGQIAASEAASVEKQNETARNAANGSDDPLKSGFDSLRRKAGNR